MGLYPTGLITGLKKPVRNLEGGLYSGDAVFGLQVDGPMTRGWGGGGGYKQQGL